MTVLCALATPLSKCYIIVGKKIVSQLEEEELDEGMLALLASFYLLDFDYLRHHEIGLTFMQQLVFEDMNVPIDLATSFNLAITNYNNFKSD